MLGIGWWVNTVYVWIFRAYMVNQADDDDVLAAPYKAIIACIAYTCTTNLSNCLGGAVV